ncbi:hypothetical protein Tco_0820522 [Tanacetum coccineum]|uniref:Uncharacterized protein n=1 Tax=Tanacetum coccineum TaxID=301880 RepID=A0ABQ5ADQ4_9ASTR
MVRTGLRTNSTIGGVGCEDIGMSVFLIPNKTEYNIPSPFVIVLTLWSLLLGPGAVPTDTTLSNRHSLAHSHEEATSAMVKAQGVWVFALNTLTELAQHVTSKNDMLAILRCPQCDPTAIKLDQKIEMNEGYGLKAWEETQEARRIQGSL